MKLTLFNGHKCIKYEMQYPVGYLLLKPAKYIEYWPKQQMIMG